MNKIIKFASDFLDDSTFSPWENTPSRSTTHACKKLNSSEDLPIKTFISPYRPRTIQSKQSARRYSMIVQNIIFETPPRTKGFPKRNFKTPIKFGRKENEKIKFRENDGISVSELENIERVQQLIPYKPGLLLESRNKPTRSSTVSSDIKPDYGIIKESNFTSTFYKRFNKHSI